MRDAPLILWDLDGTLTDPMLGITSAVQYALRAFSIEETDRRKLYPFIGPPLKESFMRFYGFSDVDATRAVGKYREYFSETGIFQNEVYPGIPELLKQLSLAERISMLATSKPTVFARRILSHFQLEDYFSFVAGSELDGTRTQKAEVVRYALEQAGRPVAEKAVLIGDRCYDVVGAHDVGIACIGVTYGYGSRKELEQAGADAVVDSVEELYALLLKKDSEQEMDQP